MRLTLEFRSPVADSYGPRQPFRVPPSPRRRNRNRPQRPLPKCPAAASVPAAPAAALSAQQRLLQQADQLVDLAGKLKAEVDRTNQYTLSLITVRRARTSRSWRRPSKSSSPGTAIETCREALLRPGGRGRKWAARSGNLLIHALVGFLLDCSDQYGFCASLVLLSHALVQARQPPVRIRIVGIQPDSLFELH